MRNAWTLLALALLLGPALLPAATAQVPAPAPEPALCFREDPAPAVGSPKSCPGGSPDAPNYKQGDVVRIRIENFRPETGAAPWVLVECVTGCLDEREEPERREYWAKWDGSVQHLRFPHDFRDVGPSGKGRVALEDLAPRYNGTWRVTAFLPAKELVRTFNVWLFSLHMSRNLTVAPGEEHVFEASGIPTNATVNFTIERRTLAGYVPLDLPNVPTRPQANGALFYIWRVPLDETVRMGECPTTETYCYRAIVRVAGGAKREEVMPFRVGSAEIKITMLVGTRADGTPEARERTQVASVALDLHYPGGRLNLGPELTPGHLRDPPPGEPAEIRLRVERVNFTTPDRALGVGEIRLRYSQTAFRWEGAWTIPRDLELSPQAVFRVQLPETHDKWGNRIPPRAVSNYTIDAATLFPTLTHANATLMRTAQAVVAVDVRYHNGTPVTDRDLKGPLLGCFVRDGSTIPCSNTTAAGVQAGEFRDGVWRFTKTYPRDYEGLGRHAFILLGGTDAEDRWGNRVNRTRSDAMEVVVASPNIAFGTIMRGRAVTELERGQDIQLVATITYADGRPYNHTVRVHDKQEESRRLLVNLTKRGPNGDLVDVVPLALEERDVERGLWVGSLRLTLDDTETPVGRWSFEFDVRDNLTTPNVNRTVLDRLVVAAPLRYEALRLSNPAPATNTPAANLFFTFRLRYPTGGEVAGSAVAPGGLYAQVYKWDAAKATHVGEPLSNIITPQWSTPEHPNVWSLRYTVPPHLFSGPYVFVIQGQDSSGNRLPGDAYSPTFTPSSRVVTRQIVTPPPERVQRGEDATVVFAAQDGDTGVDGTGKPAIVVERWNDQAARWDPVAGGSDVRHATDDLVNHVGVFPVTATTPIGTYRFRFAGRDSTLNLVEGTSRNFTVEPTEVTRAVVEPPPEWATKGSTVYLRVEYRSGDRITDVRVLEELRPSNLPAPTSTLQGDVLNVTWEIPLEAPNGNYTIRFLGRDQYGNTIRIDSPPIEARPAQLHGKVLGNPPRLVERGSPATMLFGVTYPSGAYYTSATLPRVVVRNETAVAGAATVELRGLTYEATWTPPAHAGAGEHWFEVQGEGAAGNSLPLLRSTSFRLGAGSFERAQFTPLGGSHERFATVTWSVPVQPEDRAVTFRIDYYGTGSDVTRAIEERAPLLSTPLSHTLDPTRGTYVARWVTDQTTPVGVWRFVMTGEDHVGNEIVARSNPTLLTTTAVIVQIDQQPPAEAFGEARTLTFGFTATYKNGPIFTDRDGAPTVQMLIENIQTTETPTVTFADGRWSVTWTAPDVLVPGRYTLSISGFDNAGNQFTLAKSVPYEWDASFTESFAKTIPHAGLPLTLLGLVALALLLRRRAA